MLFSIDSESRKAVDAISIKIVHAGGELYSKPSESQGWMYVFGFNDLHGHRKIYCI